MKKILFYLMVPLLLVGIGACLDDKGYTDIINSENKGPIVSLFGRQNGLFASAVPISESEKIGVTVTAANANSDMTVTFKIDQTALDAHNDLVTEEGIAAGDTLANGDPDFDVIDLFDILPDSVFTIPSLSVSIPKGTLDVDLDVLVNSSKMSLYDNYILPLVIESVSGDASATIASNINTILLYVQVKNRFDGHYKVEGTMVDYANGNLIGPYPWDVYLITNGANQVTLFDNEYTFDIYHKIKNGSASSYYGSFGVVFDFDANNNVISVTNLYGQPASNGRSAELDPSGVNKWDPVTKTLKVKYWMNQPASFVPHRTSFDETFTYLGERP